ncbi:MAG: fibronectin type III-like domain-contianing protein, partial [Bifidobacteriaceae bacterium]|nr:fibronectin type III-like domain-contianing protein [Bifidobacteriaceae bacterium]
LTPGWAQTVTVTFDVANMASYDDGGYTVGDGGAKSAWVLEAGDYPIYVGNSVRSAVQRGTHIEETTRVTEQLTEALAVYPATSAFQRWHAIEGTQGEIELAKTGQTTPVRTIDLKALIEAGFPADSPYAASSPAADPVTLLDVYNDPTRMDAFLEQLTLDELALVTAGCNGCGIGGAAGAVAVYGGLSATLVNTYKVPNISACDGPAGARLSATATQVPNGVALAATWNEALIEELFRAIGEEVRLNGASTLLAPGMNIHRDPLGGRNFEYFSEDPLITGQTGSAVVKGVQSQGVSATPKHFAANNHETNRKTSDSRVSERALREIYLKGFEIVVKGAKPQNIMTSYNKINSVQAHNNYQLTTTILREEWGFDGVAMTDWSPTMATDPDFAGITGNAYRLRAGTDLLMPGGQSADGAPAAAVRAGALNVGEVQIAARRVLEFSLKSARFRTTNSLPLYEYVAGTAPFGVTRAQAAPAQAYVPAEVDMVYLDGAALPGFNPTTIAYTVYLPSGQALPVVTAAAPAMVSTGIVQASPSNPRATVTASAPGGNVSLYTVTFSPDRGTPMPGVGQVSAALTSISVDGTALAEFTPERETYTVWVGNPSAADVEATAGPGVQVSVQRDGDVVRLRSESPSEFRYYTVTLTGPQTSARLPHSDEFDGTSLKEFWSVENPNSANYSAATEGVLTITGEGGDWFRDKTGQRNIVSQLAEGDWTGVVKLSPSILPSEAYQQVGAMVYQDQDNYAQLSLKFTEGSRRWGLVQETGGNPVEMTVASVLPEEANGPILLRIDKVGNTYTFYTARVDTIRRCLSWLQIGPGFTGAWSEPKFGLFTSTG